MAGLHHSVDLLDAHLTALRQRWEAARAVWNDAVGREFEQMHWAQLEEQTRSTVREMARLAEVIAQAERAVK